MEKDSRIKHIKKKAKQEIIDSGSLGQQLIILYALLDDFIEYHLDRRYFDKTCNKNARAVMIGLNNKIIDNPFPEPKTDRLKNIIKDLSKLLLEK